MVGDQVTIVCVGGDGVEQYVDDEEDVNQQVHHIEEAARLDVVPEAQLRDRGKGKARQGRRGGVGEGEGAGG